MIDLARVTHRLHLRNDDGAIEILHRSSAGPNDSLLFEKEPALLLGDAHAS